jgi:2-dehydro-3-deoxyphosphogluconate aldolase/(4S)-4-hydroxy-2-oxoglutarate aldolase
MKKSEVRARIESIGIIPAIRVSSADDAMFAAESVYRGGLQAGAKFLTSDGIDLDVIKYALAHDVVVFPGALTPTDVLTAWKAGSDFVKVVPCGHVGGDSYIKSLKAMFPKVPLIAAGGVNQKTAHGFILAGAVALGIGKELVSREAIRLRQDERIRTLADRFLNLVNDARSQTAGH